MPGTSGYAMAFIELQGIGRLESFDVRNAGTGSDYFERVARAFERSTKWPRVKPPWSFLDMMQHRKVRENLRALQNLPPREMIERAQQRADTVQAQLIGRIRRYIERRFSDQIRDGLLAGVAIAAACGGLAAAAGASGPFALAVAAIGAIVGFILGMIDWQGMQIRDAWRRTVEAMTPLERYFSLAGFRVTSQQTRADVRKPALVPWVLVENDRTGKENIVLDTFQDLCRLHCLPDPGNDNDRKAVALWFATLIANYRPVQNGEIGDLWRRYARVRREQRDDGTVRVQAMPAGDTDQRTPQGSEWIAPFLAQLAPFSASELVALAADPAHEPVNKALRAFRRNNNRLMVFVPVPGVPLGLMPTDLTTEDDVRAHYSTRNPWFRVDPMRDIDQIPFGREFMARYEAEVRELTS